MQMTDERSSDNGRVIFNNRRQGKVHEKMMTAQLLSEIKMAIICEIRS